MKKPIILLALFAVLMVATLVWSAGRNRDGGDSGAPGQTNCNDVPRKGNDEVDKGKLKPWMTDCFNFKRLGASANRYTSGVLLNPVTIDLPGNLRRDTRGVDGSGDEDPRVVKLERVSGGAVEVTARQPGEDDQQLCLCDAGDALARDNQSSREICVVALEDRSCTASDQRGTITVGQRGATLEFRSVSGAQVRSVE